MTKVTRSTLERAGLTPSAPLHDLPQSSHCPACRRVLDQASAPDGQPSAPRPGDLTLCGYCGVTLVFTRSLRHRLATQKELDSLTPEERDSFDVAQRLIESTKRQRHD